MYEGSGEELLIPEPEEAKRSKPYDKEAFRYEAAGDCYQCPQGQVLSFVGTEWHKTGQEVRVYQAPGKLCRACPAFGQCTRRRRGRRIRVGAFEELRHRHRERMTTPEAKATYRRGWDGGGGGGVKRRPQTSARLE